MEASPRNRGAKRKEVQAFERAFDNYSRKNGDMGRADGQLPKRVETVTMAERVKNPASSDAHNIIHT